MFEVDWLTPCVVFYTQKNLDAKFSVRYPIGWSYVRDSVPQCLGINCTLFSNFRTEEAGAIRAPGGNSKINSCSPVSSTFHLSSLP